MTHTLLVPAMYNLCLLEPRICASRSRRPGGSAATAARRWRPRPSRGWRRAAAAAADECLWRDRDHLARDADAAGGDRGAADSVGRAVPCAEVLVMDEAGREVPRGAIGEIWLRGPMVVKGYWDNPRGDSRELRRRLLALGRHRLDRRGGLCARARPQEGHDQPRRLQDLLRRGGECPDGPSRRVEAAVIAKRLPGARRARARLRVREEPAGHRRRCWRAIAPACSPTTRCRTASACATRPLPRNANGKVMKRELRQELRGRVTGEGFA